MNILLPMRDILSEHPLEALYYRRAFEEARGIDFHWPSRGRDLRSARDGMLPPNARPFPIDDPAGIATLASRSLGVHGDFAKPLLAAFLAWQGAHFDVVEIPSTLPVAHLVRPAAEAFGVTVGTVAQSWLGSASDVAGLAWPDTAGPLEIESLARLDAESDSAVELRLAPAAACPPCLNGAPRRPLALRTVMEGAHRPAVPAPGRLFAPAGLPGTSLGPFLHLVATLPETLRQHARLPRDLPAEVRRALAADPVGSRVPQLNAGETAVSVDVAPRPVFNPAPLEALLGGGRAIVHARSWTAGVLDRLHPDAAPHGVDFDQPRGIEAFAAALDAPATVGISDSDLDGLSLAAIHGEATATHARLVPVVVEVDVDERLHHEFEASLPTLRRATEPQISFVVAGGDGAARRLAATLACLARLVDLRSEAIVVADETTGDVRRLAALVRAAGPNARMLHMGRGAGLLRIIQEARAPLVAFLEAGDRVAPRFGQWALEVMADGTHVAAPTWATLRFARPGPARPLTGPSELQLGPAAVFRREVLTELGGSPGIPGLRAAARRIARYHGPEAIYRGPATTPLALAGDSSAYASSMASVA